MDTFLTQHVSMQCLLSTGDQPGSFLLQDPNELLSVANKRIDNIHTLGRIM